MSEDQKEDAAPQASLVQMINGYWITQSIYVAARLRIADLLSTGPRSAAELAAKCEADPGSLYRLLRALASLGLFSERKDGRFALTPLAEFLRSDVPGSLRGIATYSGDPEHYRAWGDLLYSVQTGKRSFDHVFGKRVFDYMAEHPDVAETFDAAMKGYTTEVARALAAGYDFSGIDTIVDVGGGVGTLLAELLKANPEMRGVLVDLPHVIERAAGFFAANKLDGRCRLAASDFFKSIPGGGDAYVLKWILHDWEDERALAILRNCHAAMKGKGKLLVVEAVVSPGNDPSFAKLLDLNMLVMTGGRERTLEEWRALLEAARFAPARVTPVHPMASIIEAHPK